MNASAAELASLRTVSIRFGPLRDRIVFVGGMIRSLLITDPAAPPPRPTDDIDVIAAVQSRAEYYALAKQLRQLGFREDHSEGAPVCRWIIDGLKVDVMPNEEEVLGFSNRWYTSAWATSNWHTIGNAEGGRIRVIDAPHFVATKLESFRARSGGDLYHHDMEDIIAVIDGRAELIGELNNAPAGVRAFVANDIDALMRDEAFHDALAGHLPGDKASQARLPLVEARLRKIVALEH